MFSADTQLKMQMQLWSDFRNNFQIENLPAKIFSQKMWTQKCPDLYGSLVEEGPGDVKCDS